MLLLPAPSEEGVCFGRIHIEVIAVSGEEGDRLLSSFPRPGLAVKPFDDAELGRQIRVSGVSGV